MVKKEENLCHFSDCAIYNEPAFRNRPCDCGLEDRLNKKIKRLKGYANNLEKKLDEICKITDY